MLYVYFPWLLVSNRLTSEDKTTGPEQCVCTLKPPLADMLSHPNVLLHVHA